MNEEGVVLVFYWLLVMGVFLLILGAGAYIADKLPEETIRKLERWLGGRF